MQDPSFIPHLTRYLQGSILFSRRVAEDAECCAEYLFFLSHTEAQSPTEKLLSSKPLMEYTEYQGGGTPKTPCCRKDISLCASLCILCASACEYIYPLRGEYDRSYQSLVIKKYIKMKWQIPSEVIRLSISGHHECPEMDTLFDAITDYQWVTDLARFWHGL